jgi:hypothetical protein
MGVLLQLPVLLTADNNIPDIPVFDFERSPLTSFIQITLIFVIPILVGLITDHLSPGALKVALHGGIAFATTFLNSWLDALVSNTDYHWINALANGLITWLLGIVVHKGIWKPAGVEAKAQESSALQLFGPAKNLSGRHSA